MAEVTDTRKPWRFSALTSVIVLLVFFALAALSPSVKTLLAQQQAIKDQEALLELNQQLVTDLEVQRDRWSDPSYIRSVARERLYYVLPGETTYLLTGVDQIDLQTEQAEVSQELEATKLNWSTNLVGSFFYAGLADPEPVEVVDSVTDDSGEN